MLVLVVVDAVLVVVVKVVMLWMVLVLVVVVVMMMLVGVSVSEIAWRLRWRLVGGWCTISKSTRECVSRNISVLRRQHRRRRVNANISNESVSVVALCRCHYAGLCGKKFEFFYSGLNSLQC